MSDKYKPLKRMCPDQELHLLDKCPFFAVGKQVTSQAGGPARHRQPVISREFQGVDQKIVDLFSKPPVAAINGRCANAILVESNLTFVNAELFSRIHNQYYIVQASICFQKVKINKKPLRKTISILPPGERYC
jgi:hypothetical protein